MTGFSLTLVLVAACLHASWNFLAKRAGTGGPPFVWLFGALSTVVYLPIAIAVVVIGRPHLGTAQILFMLGSGVLHLSYFTLLQSGYRHGDLSVVYPLARGTGPMLSSAAAILVLGERPSAQAIAGGLVICGGIFVLSRAAAAPRASGMRSVGVTYGVLTGCIIAVYTLWDKHTVSALAVPPIVLDWSSNFVRTALLTPVVLRKRGEVASVWRAHRREVVGVALLAPLAYILVLTALRLSAVTYIAPAREVSILIGTVLGATLLEEGFGGGRLVGALLVTAGLIALATG